MVFGNHVRAALYRDNLQICEFRRRNKHKKRVLLCNNTPNYFENAGHRQDQATCKDLDAPHA